MNQSIEVGLTVRGHRELLDALTNGMTEVRVPGPVNGPPDVTVKITQLPLQKAFDIPTVVTITLTFAGSVASSVAGDWLYNLAKRGRVEKIMINRREVELHQGEITRMVEETRTEERRG